MKDKKCSVCSEKYETGRSKCPHCGAPNRLFESPTFVQFATEVDRAVFTALEEVARREGRTIEEIVNEAIEAHLTGLSLKRRKA